MRNRNNNYYDQSNYNQNYYNNQQYNNTNICPDNSIPQYSNNGNTYYGNFYPQDGYYMNYSTEEYLEEYDQDRDPNYDKKYKKFTIAGLIFSYLFYFIGLFAFSLFLPQTSRGVLIVVLLFSLLISILSGIAVLYCRKNEPENHYTWHQYFIEFVAGLLVLSNILSIGIFFLGK